MAEKLVTAESIHVKWATEPPVEWVVRRGQRLEDKLSHSTVVLNGSGIEGAMIVKGDDPAKEAGFTVNLGKPATDGEVETSIRNKFGRTETGPIHVDVFLADGDGSPLKAQER